MNNVDKLFESLSVALAYLDRSGQWELLSRSYNLLAITSANRGNAPLAMDYYLSALSYCEKYHMQDVGIIVNMNIGALYNRLGEYSQAQQYYEIGYQTLCKTKMSPEYFSYLLTYYIGIGNTYLYREFPEKAAYYIQKPRWIAKTDSERSRRSRFAVLRRAVTIPWDTQKQGRLH